MVAISWMIVELKDNIGNCKGIIKGTTNQRILFPEPATDTI